MSTETTSTDTKIRAARPGAKKKSNGRKRSEAAKKPPTAPVRYRLRDVTNQLAGAFVDRSDAVDMIALAVLARFNFLMVGVHGTAKTLLIKAFFSHVTGARLFAPGTCGSFTTVDELFGPTDIAAYQRGEWRRTTTGRLAEVEYAFLDEVMKLSGGAFNMMLTAMNEREYEGGDIPLRAMGAATNWPEVKQRTEKVEAGYDRFVLRLAVARVEDEVNLNALQDLADALEGYKPVETVSLAELDAAYEAVNAVAIPATVRDKLTNVCVRCRKEGVDVSERRLVQARRVLRANAWIRGADEVGLEDFGALRFVFWVDEPDVEVIDAIIDTLDQETVKKCVGVIDAARREYQRLRKADKNSRLRDAPRVIKSMRKAAKEVRAILAAQGVTERGKTTIREQMGKMREEVQALHTELREQLGLDEAAEGDGPEGE